ncbi:MAG: hypothetical protein WD512_11865 [Candidatus Paceibacterota bacterium]
MSLPQDPFLLNITRYLNRKNPYSNQSNSNKSNSNRNNDSNSNSNSSPKESHNHYSSSYFSYQPAFPSWFWWHQPQPTIINHNYNSILSIDNKNDSDDDSKSKKNEGITATKVISGLILLSTVAGVGYIMINNYFDLKEEQDLYQKLKKSMYRDSNPPFYSNLKVILKSNAGYSKRMFVTKMIGSACGIGFLYNLFYVDNVQVMNGLYILLGGTSLYGIYNYIKHQRLQASDEIRANYENVDHFLNNPTIPSNPPPTAPLDPPEYQYAYMQNKETS